MPAQRNPLPPAGSSSCSSQLPGSGERTTKCLLWVRHVRGKRRLLILHHHAPVAQH